MADSLKVYSLTKKAAADLSSLQYHGVVLDSDGKVEAVNAATDVPFGIVQNTPVTDEAASIIPIGPGGSSKMKAGAVVDEGDQVSLSTTGTAIAAASGSYTLGICETGGNTNDLIKVLLNNITIKA